MQMHEVLLTLCVVIAAAWICYRYIPRDLELRG